MLRCWTSCPVSCVTRCDWHVCDSWCVYYGNLRWPRVVPELRVDMHVAVLDELPSTMRTWHVCSRMRTWHVCVSRCVG